jgi:hypothetical protein
MANKRDDYSKVREMSDAKQEKDKRKAMKNKTGNGSSESTSNTKAVKGKSSKESISPSTPAKRKAKQKKDMKNKTSDGSSKSKSSVTATNKPPRPKSISTPATRKAKQKKDMKNIRGPGAVDKSSPTQVQKKAVKKKTPLLTTATSTPAPVRDKGSRSQKYQNYIDSIKRASKKKTASTPEKETSWLGSLFGGQDRNVNPKTATKVDEDLQTRHGGRSGSSYAKGGPVKAKAKPRGWGKARRPKCK